jgi:glycosyltransferase involved in cell wall biosynthesis
MTPLYFDEASYLGGGERYPLNLAKAVAMTGEYEVEIVSYGEASSVRDLAPGVRLRVLASASRRAGGERLSWEVISAVRDVELVHLHQIFCRPSEVALLTAKLLHRRLCATDHGGATSWLGSSLRALDLVDQIVSQSDFAASLLADFTENPIRVVHGGVDDTFFAPPAEASARDGVVFVGRLLPHKGIDRLIAALPPGLPLTVCGRPYDARYFAFLKALAVGKQVEFITVAGDDDVRDLYRRAIAVVLPSVYVDCYGNPHPWPELMGFSVMEGMACGAPAICSRVGGMPEYVEHGSTGFVFDELAELTASLERLAADPELVGRMGRAAREGVEKRFGLAVAGASLRSIYDELLEVEPEHEGARGQQPVSA